MSTLRGRSEQRDYRQIWNSLMYSNEGGISDFGNYVVNSALTHWTNSPIKNGIRPKTQKELYEEFLHSLTGQQKRLWNKKEKTKQLFWNASFIVNFESYEKQKNPTSKEKLEKQRRELESKIIHITERFLNLSTQEQKKIYTTVVIPYITTPKKREDGLDCAAIQRLIFSRIIRLGWDPKLFAEFDSNITAGSRMDHKSERIGKKYQWVAFYEILARISDNFALRESWSGDIGQYKGPWQVWTRDIDPSCLLRATKINSSYHNCWWSRISYRNWKPSIKTENWAKNKKDLPRQSRLIELNHKKNGKWLTLEGYVEWEQPIIPGEEKYSTESRRVWYIIKSYLIKKQDAKGIFEWAKKQDFMGRWMPESNEFYKIFLKEFPFSVAYVDSFNSNGRSRWIKAQNKDHKDTGAKVLITDEEYSGEASGFDCSVDDTVRVKLPAKDIYKKMGLKKTGDDGVFVDKSNEAVVMDPSVKEEGPGVLLVKKDKLLKFLKQNNYEILWVLIGEKLIIGGNAYMSSFPGRLETGGAYKMGSDGKLIGKNYTKFLPPRKT